MDPGKGGGRVLGGEGSQAGTGGRRGSRPAEMTSPGGLVRRNERRKEATSALNTSEVIKSEEQKYLIRKYVILKYAPPTNHPPHN